MSFYVLLCASVSTTISLFGVFSSHLRSPKTNVLSFFLNIIIYLYVYNCIYIYIYMLYTYISILV